MNADIPDFLLARSGLPKTVEKGRGRSVSLVDQGIAGFAKVIRTTFVQWELASRSGFLQKLDPRIKTLFWIALLVVISVKNTVSGLLFIAGAIALIAVISKAKLSVIYGKAIPLAFFFGFLVSAPAMLNIITPGTIIVRMADFSQPYSFWIYSVPQHIGITEEGVIVCSKLTLRVFASLSVTFLVLATTSFAEIIRSLKLFRMPDTLLLVLTLTYKYVYLFSQTIVDMFLAKKTRLVLGVSSAEFRRWSAGRMATIFRKTERKVDDIYQAMLCRGFSGKIRLSGSRKFRTTDIAGAVALAFFVLAALAL
jgi:cobalt/nickel transport system permease protein